MLTISWLFYRILKVAPVKWYWNLEFKRINFSISIPVRTLKGISNQKQSKFSKVWWPILLALNFNFQQESLFLVKNYERLENIIVKITESKKVSFKSFSESLIDSQTGFEIQTLYQSQK